MQAGCDAMTLWNSSSINLLYVYKPTPMLDK